MNHRDAQRTARAKPAQIGTPLVSRRDYHDSYREPHKFTLPDCECYLDALVTYKQPRPQTHGRH